MYFAKAVYFCSLQHDVLQFRTATDILFVVVIVEAELEYMFQQTRPRASATSVKIPASGRMLGINTILASRLSRISRFLRLQELLGGAEG